MTTITGQNTTETSQFRFTAFASDLNFEIGRYPSTLETTLGNGQPFRLTHVEHDMEGETLAAHYSQPLGCITLTVFND